MGCLLILGSTKIEWGFFGHRKINRMAIFTLPQEMLPLFKKYITYIEEHSVDPDARRYASKYEAVRHYIDLDQWGNLPFNDLPRDFESCLTKYGKFEIIDQGKLSQINIQVGKDSVYLINDNSQTISVRRSRWIGFFKRHFMSQYYEDIIQVPIDTVMKSFGIHLNGQFLRFEDQFSEHGILPYYLKLHTDRLTDAFKNQDLEKILRLSAELGHYVGDAHVPLHTTKNYNGQLTDQIGIHAFWESRLPELFANAEYDFFTGKATYINDIQTFAWKIVLESHILLPQVLEGEKELSLTYPKDNQFCYEERLGVTVRNYCHNYARAYQKSLDGMVERRMAEAIQAIGSLWYTAYVNGGQPNLRKLTKSKEIKFEEEKIIPDTNIKVREHEN
jgi:hypothetical protein